MNSSIVYYSLNCSVYTIKCVSRDWVWGLKIQAIKFQQKGLRLLCSYDTELYTKQALLYVITVCNDIQYKRIPTEGGFTIRRNNNNLLFFIRVLLDCVKYETSARRLEYYWKGAYYVKDFCVAWGPYCLGRRRLLIAILLLDVCMCLCICSYMALFSCHSMSEGERSTPEESARPLKFESRFESGNLRKAIQVRDCDLWCRCSRLSDCGQWVK